MDPLNAEFIRLLANSGWSQAEAAARLKVTPSAVSGYVNDNIRPSIRVIKAFKLLIGDILPMPEHGLDAMELNDESRQLSDEERKLIETLRGIDAPTRREITNSFHYLASLVPSKTVKYPAIKRHS